MSKLNFKKIKLTQKYKKLLRISVLYLLVVVFFLFALWQDNYLTVSNYEYKNEKIPVMFDGFKIMQISDLHNKWFGSNQGYITAVISGEKPDIIIVTGDTIDANRTDYNCALTFLLEVQKIAPTYIVSGNHEAADEKFENIMSLYASSGAAVVDDKSVKIWRGGQYIYLDGIADKHFEFTDSENKRINSEKYMESVGNLNKTLKKVTIDGEFNVLLAHRPEYYDLYQGCGADLVFSGHAHGGQIRLPFTQGLYAPGQGYFPKYTSGMHTFGDTTLVISRGLGNSQFPVRIFNFPEIVTVTLRK